MDILLQIVQTINGCLSDYILIALLIGAGLFSPSGHGSYKSVALAKVCAGFWAAFPCASAAKKGAFVLSGIDNRHRRAGRHG